MGNPAFARFIGTTIAGQYEITRLIGAGGMGAVFAASEKNLDREVAVKLIHPEHWSDPRAALRLLDEARITAKLDHDNIVRVINAGQDDEGGVFFVQELLEGHTLAQELHVWHPVPHVTIGRARHMLDALATAHRAGIAHLDFKPQNIVLARRNLRERLVVLDFGIAREMQLERTRSGTTGAMMRPGTAHYMSPEHIEGERKLDARADVFAAGVVLYEMLTRDVPWRATTWPSLTHEIAREPIRDVREECPWDMPEPLAHLVMKALSRDPNARFRDAGEMRIALDAIDLREFMALHSFHARMDSKQMEAWFQRRKARSPSWRPKRDGTWNWLVWSNILGYPEEVIQLMRWGIEIGLHPRLLWFVNEPVSYLSIEVYRPVSSEFTRALQEWGFQKDGRDDWTRVTKKEIGL